MDFFYIWCYDKPCKCFVRSEAVPMYMYMVTCAIRGLCIKKACDDSFCEKVIIRDSTGLIVAYWSMCVSDIHYLEQKIIWHQHVLQ